MGLFWKRTKKEDSGTPPQAPPEQVTEVADHQEEPIQATPTQPIATPEKKTGFLKKLFKGQEAEPTVPSQPVVTTSSSTATIIEPGTTIRVPEQEKKSFWDRWRKSQEAEETGNTAPVGAMTRTENEDTEKKSRFQRWKASLNRTSETIMGRLEDVFRGKKTIDAEVLDSLEEALIGADIGVQTALEIIEIARKQVDRKEINNFDELKRIIKDQLLAILRGAKQKGIVSETEVSPDIRPYVMMIVGVNGVGKTTTIGKLANRIKADGNEILICAADTFRAAATDQLAIWADRTGVTLIQQKQGTDPAAVLFDSLAAAKARDADVLIVDTAGRLHNKGHLMAELEKMKRIAAGKIPGAPHEVLLVVDAVTGQNGLEQARQFLKIIPVTGIVLTKLDGTAKGGIVVAISKELGIPIRYVGIGEGINDLVEFSPEDYVDSLFN